jgi:hypothetical protein
MRIHHLLIDAHFTVDAGLAAGSATSLMVLSSIKLKSLTLRQVEKELISALTSMLAYNPTTLKRLDLAPVKVVGVDEFSSSVWGLIRLGGRALEDFEWESVSSRRTSQPTLHPGPVLANDHICALHFSIQPMGSSPSTSVLFEPH